MNLYREVHIEELERETENLSNFVKHFLNSESAKQEFKKCYFR